MQIKGQHHFEAPREEVWAALHDAEALSKTLPGFQELQQVAENEFAGTLAIGIGPVQGRFEGKVTLSNLLPPESYSLHMSGRGTPGFVDGKGDIRLEERHDGTLLCYDIDLNIGGRIAGVGQRLLDMTSRMLTEQALKSLGRQIAARAEK